MEEAAATAGQIQAGQHGPSPEAREEEPLQGGSVGGHEPAEGPRRSPQATAEDGPSVGPEAGVKDSTPRRSTWILVLGIASLSGTHRSSAFQRARSALDGLEAQLASEEPELNKVRAETCASWRRWSATATTTQPGAQHEEALCFAKEVRQSAACTWITRPLGYPKRKV